MTEFDLHFIINGRIAGSSVLTSIAREFGNLRHVVHCTTHRGDAIKRALASSEDGATHIIAVGGDGTLNEVVNGILAANTLGAKPILSVLPRGSGNDVARMFSISSSVTELRERVMRGRCRDLDVLELHCNDVHGNAIQRFCFNVADVGLGGMVTQIADQQPRWLPSDLKYFLSVIMGLRRYKNSRLTYQSEVDSWSGRAMSICMANCVFFGSGMGIAPDAQPDDGVAEITIIGDVGVLDYLRQTPSLRKARRLNHPQIEYRRARWCSIDAENPCPIELDGEFIGQTPLTMHVVPRAIRFLV